MTRSYLFIYIGKPEKVTKTDKYNLAITSIQICKYISRKRLNALSIMSIVNIAVVLVIMGCSPDILVLATLACHYALNRISELVKSRLGYTCTCHNQLTGNSVIGTLIISAGLIADLTQSHSCIMKSISYISHLTQRRIFNGFIPCSTLPLAWRDLCRDLLLCCVVKAVISLCCYCTMG